MSKSSLTTYTLISPCKTHPRNHKIDTITIHCFVGQVTARRGCEIFQNENKQASSNYVVGYDGSIGLCVDEGDRSWCTGGALTVNGMTGKQNDHRAVTIEVACESAHPYAVTAAAYEALIQLVADIAKRNGLGRLTWKADKALVGKPEKQNMTVHRWFAAKACPGDYLYTRMGEIAERANAINYPAEEQGEEKGMDANTPATWAAEAWEKAKTKKGRDGTAIMDGTRPADQITRQEVATILDRLGLLES